MELASGGVWPRSLLLRAGSFEPGGIGGRIVGLQEAEVVGRLDVVPYRRSEGGDGLAHNATSGGAKRVIRGRGVGVQQQQLG